MTEQGAVLDNVNINVRHGGRVLRRIRQIHKRTERKTRRRGINDLQVGDSWSETRADLAMVAAGNGCIPFSYLVYVLKMGINARSSPTLDGYLAFGRYFANFELSQRGLDLDRDFGLDVHDHVLTAEHEVLDDVRKDRLVGDV